MAGKMKIALFDVSLSLSPFISQPRFRPKCIFWM